MTGLRSPQEHSHTCLPESRTWGTDDTRNCGKSWFCRQTTAVGAGGASAGCGWLLSATGTVHPAAEQLPEKTKAPSVPQCRPMRKTTCTDTVCNICCQLFVHMAGLHCHVH